MSEILANDRVTLHCGDSREKILLIPDNSIDSIVTDPPYALVSISKRFGKDGAAPAKSNGKTGVYKRASAGFMGARWDNGDTAFSVEFWEQALRVLKPGAHLIAFSGTRTYHRMACAIEDAGFEVRDQLAWAYGSGFPKSHDVSKGIDSHLFYEWLEADPARLAAYQAAMRATKKIEDEDKRRAAIRDIEAKWRELGGFARKVIATREAHDIRGGNLMEASQGVGRGLTEYAYTEAATPEAAEWEGWGTALKPAWEPCVLARKPLIGTVAENVLAHGTGGLNIDACRVGDRLMAVTRSNGELISSNVAMVEHNTGRIDAGEKVGGWPSNILTDGSDEVSGAFPIDPNSKESPARFFYTAKADVDDRLGSKHPTVKPVDLMQYFVRMVTRKGGTVLDMFAGTGTTGEAAYREGMRAVLIEREPEYQNDIRRRMSLALGGPDERKFASIKAGGKAEAAGPLFAFEPTGE